MENEGCGDDNIDSHFGFLLGESTMGEDESNMVCSVRNKVKFGNLDVVDNEDGEESVEA